MTGRGAAEPDAAAASVTEALARRMLEDPAAFRRPGEARDRARDLARRERIAALGVLLSNAVQRAQEQSPLPVRPEAVQRALGAAWDDLAAAAAAAFLSNQYDRVFAEARARAVAAQQRAAETNTRFPDPGAVDQQWSALVGAAGEPKPDAAQSLAAWIAARLAPAAGPLFEEVARQVDDAGRRAAEDAVRQFACQTDAMARAAAPGDAVTAGDLEPLLLAAAAAAAAEARRDAAAAGRGLPVYPVFAAARRRASAEAARLEQDRLAAFARAHPARLAEADALREILRAPARHRRPADSAARLADTAMDAARDRLAAQYGGPARAAYLAERLRGDGPAARAWRAATAAAVAPVLPAARARAAERQLAPLADGLRPGRAAPDAVVARWHDQGCRGAATAADALARLREEGLPAEAPDLIEEAATQLVAQVDARVRMAGAALDGQLRLLRDLERERAAALERDVADARPVDRIVREWRGELATRWERAAPAGMPYRRLLTRADDQLNKTVRQLYDARRQDQAKTAAAAAADTRPAEPVPPRTDALDRGTTPPETDRDEDKDKQGGLSDDVLLRDADAVLNLGDRSPREGRGSLRLGDQELAAFQYDPAAAPAAADTIFAAIREPLTRLLDDHAAAWAKASGGWFLFRRPAPPELRLYVIVAGNEVRHRTSLLLRKQVGDLVGEWSAEHRKDRDPVALRWTVGLGQMP